MNLLLSPNVLDLLPIDIMTVAGIAIMMLEPVLPAGRSRRPLGWLAFAATLLAGAACFLQLQAGPISAFSHTILVDPFAVFFQLTILAVVAVTLLSSFDYLDGASSVGEFYALLCFGTVGMLLMSCATELLVIFIGLEISSISTYILAGFRKGQATSSESAIKYFLLGSFATAFFLYGVALTFGATGSTSLPQVAAALGTTSMPIVAMLAIAMIVIGIGFKVSAAPFHVWTPDVYQGAPPPVVGMMSTAPKAAAFAVLLRILFGGFPLYQARWAMLLWVIAALSMTIGNLGALMQRDVKRMLAYSSIAHAGYLLVAFTAFPADGIAAAAFYTASYAAMNVGAFVVITAVSGYRERMRSSQDFTGLAVERPVLAAALAFFLLSMIGIPFTAGFFGKFYVFAGAIHSGHIWLAVVGLLNSGFACFYYLRLLARLYEGTSLHSAAPAIDFDAEIETGHAHLTRPELDLDGLVTPPRVGLPAALALTACVVAVLLLGILPGPVLRLVQAGTSNVDGSPSVRDAQTWRAYEERCRQQGVHCEGRLFVHMKESSPNQ